MSKSKNRRFRRRLERVGEKPWTDAIPKVGRDEAFRERFTPRLVEQQQDMVEGLNAVHKRGKAPKGGQKGGSWGPEGDGPRG